MPRQLPSRPRSARSQLIALFLFASLALAGSPAQGADKAPPPTGIQAPGPAAPPAAVRAAPPSAGPSSAEAPAIGRFHLGPWEQDLGYTQAVRAGQFLFVSGTTGRGDRNDPQGMANALRAAYERIRTTLDAHDIGFGQVVRETVYTRDIEALKAAAAARREFYPEGQYPASTWVQVDRLFEEDFLVEVELVAVLP